MRLFTATVLIPAAVLVTEPAAGLPPDAERGRLQCSLTAWAPTSGDVATIETLLGAVVAEIDVPDGDEETGIAIHPEVLQPIGRHVVRQADAAGFHLRYRGRSITAENDAVVARFRDNGLATPPAGAGERRPRFGGFKVYLGRHTERDGGRDVSVDLYLRIIVDWTYETAQHERLAVHRAAAVVSQVPLNTGAAHERFYRFAPSARPFRMLACVLDRRQIELAEKFVPSFPATVRGDPRPAPRPPDGRFARQMAVKPGIRPEGIAAEVPASLDEP